MMYRVLIFMVLLSFGVVIPAHGQNYKVNEIGENLEYVVLSDRDTGAEWVLELGDEINSWQVVKITQDYVTIAKPREGLPTLMTKIPVKGQRIINVTPGPEIQ